MKTKTIALVLTMMLAAAFTCGAQTMSPDMTKNHKPTFGNGGPRVVEVVTVKVSSSNAASIEYYGAEDATLYVVDNEYNVIDCRCVYEGEFDKVRVQGLDSGCRLIAVSIEGEMCEWKISSGKQYQH